MTALRLAAPTERIAVAHHSGPGLRAIVWVQGCSLLCTSVCLNSHLLSASGGVPVTPHDFASAVVALRRDYCDLEGLTVLGGEPFDQAEPLAQALRVVRQHGLSTMVYSGHTLIDLERHEGARALLGETDVLVDGPFIPTEYDETLIWRGSRNQRILCLSERYSPADIERAIERQRRSIFISVGGQDTFVSGAQNGATAAGLRALATRKGELP